jgi:hypothetical protein
VSVCLFNASCCEPLHAGLSQAHCIELCIAFLSTLCALLLQSVSIALMIINGAPMQISMSSCMTDNSYLHTTTGHTHIMLTVIRSIALISIIGAPVNSSMSSCMTAICHLRPKQHVTLTCVLTIPRYVCANHCAHASLLH